jgi:hypothetical protein
LIGEAGDRRCYLAEAVGQVWREPIEGPPGEIRDPDQGGFERFRNLLQLAKNMIL